MRSILALTLLLGGCSGGLRLPSEVRVPVSQPCIRAADVPAAVPPAGPLPEDARLAADLLASVVLELRRNERVLRALVMPCTR